MIGGVTVLIYDATEMLQSSFLALALSASASALIMVMMMMIMVGRGRRERGAGAGAGVTRYANFLGLEGRKGRGK